MAKQTTKWSAAALGEAIASAAKAIGYESLKPEYLALAPTSLAHCSLELLQGYITAYIPELQNLYNAFTSPFCGRASESADIAIMDNIVCVLYYTCSNFVVLFQLAIRT